MYFLGGLQMLALSIMGGYLARIRSLSARPSCAPTGPTALGEWLRGTLSLSSRSTRLGRSSTLSQLVRTRGLSRCDRADRIWQAR